MIAGAARQSQYGPWACAFLGPRGAPKTREPFFFCPEPQNLASRTPLKALSAKETRKQERASCRHARCFRLSNIPPCLDQVYWAQSCKGARLHECTRAWCIGRFSTLSRYLTWLNAGVCPLSLSRTNPPDSVRPAGCHQTRKHRRMGEILQQPREEEIDYCPIGSCLR